VATPLANGIKKIRKILGKFGQIFIKISVMVISQRCDVCTIFVTLLFGLAVKIYWLYVVKTELYFVDKATLSVSFK